MSAVRLAAVVFAMLVFAPVGNAAVAAPTGLKPFLLRADEAPARTFSRTPSFAWRPVRGATRYEFELATKSTFADGTMVYSTKALKSPTVAIPVSLPWLTGSPHALWAHVRAVTRKRTTAWSAPFGFNMRWSNIPQALPSAPGLVRWTPVEGATSYNVWFLGPSNLGPNKRIATKTNVADEREHWTFHQQSAVTGVVRWRVRAVRSKIGTTANGIPSVSYGPWSPVYVELNPPVLASTMALDAMSSDVASNGPTAFRLMPALSYNGNLALSDAFDPGVPRELYRVYIATDVDCVNVVYRGSIVGSPAWAPRTTGPLVLPANPEELAKARAGYIISDDKQGRTFAVDRAAIHENESLREVATGTPSEPVSGGSTTQVDPVEAASTAPPLVDLWDNGWPEQRYYLTVVPVAIRLVENRIEYYDTELPQDVCAAGRVFTFGKVSEAVVASAGAAPYVSGLSTNGRLFTATRARPSIYGSPLVAWKPALGADTYELQWSKKPYPWTKLGGLETPSTSAILPLKPGRWYYRVRGVSLALPQGGRQMSWSTPQLIRIARPQFRIVRSGR